MTVGGVWLSDMSLSLLGQANRDAHRLRAAAATGSKVPSSREPLDAPAALLSGVSTVSNWRISSRTATGVAKLHMPRPCEARVMH